MNALLDYVEKAAQANMAFHLENTDALRASGNSLLLLLLAGGGGALAYTAELLHRDQEPYLIGALAAVSLYLFGLAAWLSWKCLMTMPLQAPANEPGNLYQPGLDLDQIRETELENLQQRIEIVRSQNDTIGRRRYRFAGGVGLGAGRGGRGVPLPGAGDLRPGAGWGMTGGFGSAMSRSSVLSPVRYGSGNPMTELASFTVCQAPRRLATVRTVVARPPSGP